MRTADTILGLISERGKKGLPLERLYKLLFNRDLFLQAYGKLYRNKGAMTHGISDETPDGMSLAKIDAIIEALRYERYHWRPARRTFIPKKHGKKRPLGMPVWSDKLVQEVIRQILTAYFEPQFSDHSHGFRPDRGCHTALREIHASWKGTGWFIEGDISHCFASKHKMSVPKVYETYGVKLKVDGKEYTGLQVIVPKPDKRKTPLVATWGGISLAWDIKAPLDDHPPKVYHTGRTELVQRLLADFCELCGSSENVEVHHVHAMRTLHEYPGRPKPTWVKRMIALKRKTLLLCKRCHVATDHGLPLTGPLISLQEIKDRRKRSMERY